MRAPRRAGQNDMLTATVHNCSKKFRLGEGKKHLERSVASAFRELGVCETVESDHDVLWGEQWDWAWEPRRRNSFNYKHGNLVNTIPGFQDTRTNAPVGLARMHVACTERCGPDRARAWCAYTKRAFCITRLGSEVSSGVADFYKYSMALALEQGVKLPLFWIIKKQRRSYGSHFVRIVALRRRDLMSNGNFERWINVSIPEGHWAIQEYVKRPLTYRARKVDVRAWGLVTSINPLRVYLLDGAFPKVSTFAYNGSTTQLANECMHVIMPLGEGCMAYADQLVRPYPPSTRSRLFFEHIRGDRSKIAVNWTETWAEEVWPQIVIKTLMVLIESRSQPLKLDRLIKGARRGRKRFLFLSPDFVIDANGGAHMVDLNANGLMIGDQYAELFDVQNETKAAMVMLGVTGFPSAPEYAAELRAAIGDFCSQVAPCDGEDKAALAELVHEERHMSNGWTRIFPSELLSRHWGSLDHSIRKGDRATLTAQDKLTDAFIRTTWRPGHGGDQYVS